MKNGDISNEAKGVFGIKVYVEFKRNINPFSKKDSFKLEKETSDLINHIFKKTSYTVIGIIEDSFNNDNIIEYLEENSPLSEILVCSDQKSISSALTRHVFDYYVDSNESCVSRTNSPWAMTIQQANSLLGR